MPCYIYICNKLLSKNRSNEGTTLADIVAMTIYALGITPHMMMMMIKLVTTKCDDIKMVAFRDYFSTTEKLKSLIQW